MTCGLSLVPAAVAIRLSVEPASGLISLHAIALAEAAHFLVLVEEDLSCRRSLKIVR
jgi:hypothetical protein